MATATRGKKGLETVDDEVFVTTSKRGKKVIPSMRSHPDKQVTGRDSVTDANFYDALSDALSDEDENRWCCAKCKNQFTSDEDKLLECERCDKHFCINCLGKSEEEYNILQQSDSMWFCRGCKPKVAKTVTADIEIERRCNEIMEKYDKRVKDLEKKMKEKLDEKQVKEVVTNEMSKIDIGEDKVRQIVRDEMKASQTQMNEMNVRDMDRDGSSTQSTQVINAPLASGQIRMTNGAEGDSVFSSVVAEMNERKNRENNLVLFGAPECLTGEPAEKIENDKKIFQELSSHCDVPVGVGEITKVVRIGKPKPPGEHRPMIVGLANSETKVELLRNLKKLKNSPFEMISISHDMTKAQRIEEQKLYEESKRLEQQSGGKIIYRVRGPPWDRRVRKVKDQVAPPLEDQVAPPLEEGSQE